MLDVTRLRVLDAVARHGSVTAAARELDYSQSSVSHHLARLEAETGAQLLQRAGRGIRLTQAGQLLADRAAEIIGRIDAADAELSAHVGLTAGRVRLAGFASAIGSLVLPAAAAARARASRPGDRLDRHPSARGARAAADGKRRGGDHLPLRRRRGRGPRDPPAPPARRSDVPAGQPPHAAAWPASARRRGSPGAHAAAGTCSRSARRAGFEPRIGYESDDMVLIQALVAAGLCVATLPGLALRAHHADGVVATKLPGLPRRVYAATYGEPPDPPAVTALLTALTARLQPRRPPGANRERERRGRAVGRAHRDDDAGADRQRSSDETRQGAAASTIRVRPRGPGL